MSLACCKLYAECTQAAAKRYKITGSGKVLRRKPGKQHINEKFSPGHLRRLGKEVQVSIWHQDSHRYVQCKWQLRISNHTRTTCILDLIFTCDSSCYLSWFSRPALKLMTSLHLQVADSNLTNIIGACHDSLIHIRQNQSLCMPMEHVYAW